MFNRPHLTRLVLNKIREAAPTKLFIISDGPRKNSNSDKKLVVECRNLITEIDWKCDVQTKFSDINLGCRESVVSGLNWVFSQVPSAIILEDDCLPNSDFFKFCEVLLMEYESNEQIGSICGTNFEDNGLDYSYSYSKYPNVWGWATWQRVWNQYESDLNRWDKKYLKLIASKHTNSKQVQRFWYHKFQSVSKGLIDTWDYQLVFLFWRKNLIAIRPKMNLISNIGFGNEATHTLNPNSSLSNISTHALDWPLTKPADSQSDLNFEGQDQMYRLKLSQFILESIVLRVPKKFKRRLLRLMLLPPFRKFLK